MKLHYFRVFVYIVIFLLTNAVARPSRVKRFSDQRLAELETILGLSKMSGKLVTVPIGLGKLDPAKLGRKRRSESAGLMERLYIFNNDLEDSDLYNENIEGLFEED